MKDISKAIALFIHQCWVSHQIAIGQPYNVIPTDAQLKSILDGYYGFERNPAISPRENHESWLKHRKENGWVLGPVKDESLKQHPDLIPYDELPACERSKNDVFLSACRAVMAWTQALQ
jgi:hypothetical protein